MQILAFQALAGFPLRSSSLDNLQELGCGRNIQAIKSTHEASAKASAHLALNAKPILAICRDIACLE
jgi:hypothetical protein